ncbi:MAG: hypothetical protein Q8J74_09405 [Candidatus Didemnitutus sp.]|nr:hypothetical protein [Candidatus Didemnitutus sp.]
MPKASPADGSTVDPKSGRSLWWWVAGGFLFLAILWTVLFSVASLADIKTVPDAPAKRTRG